MFLAALSNQTLFAFVYIKSTLPRRRKLNKSTDSISMKTFFKAKNQRNLKYPSKIPIKKVLHCGKKAGDNSKGTQKAVRLGGACLKKLLSQCSAVQCMRFETYYCFYP